MAFEYCCFISYSHNEGDLPDKFIKDLYNTLNGEIGALTREIKICCVDWDRLKGGDYYNKRLSKALCKSACMIMVYTPTYFDKKHTYCAREFKAMEKIESKRLSLLGDLSEDHGLIIPIVYRGDKLIHSYIKDKRTYYNFSGYIPGKEGENALLTHLTYGPQLKEIAEYVYDRYLQLNELWDMSAKCKNFRFPSEKDAQSWLNRVCIADTRMRFPGRRNQP
jgi:hypothetical protein